MQTGKKENQTRKYTKSRGAPLPTLEYKVMIVDVSVQEGIVVNESGDFDQYIGEYECKVLNQGMIHSERELQALVFTENRFSNKGIQSESRAPLSSFISSAYKRVQ